MTAPRIGIRPAVRHMFLLALGLLAVLVIYHDWQVLAQGPSPAGQAEANVAVAPPPAATPSVFDKRLAERVMPLVTALMSVPSPREGFPDASELSCVPACSAISDHGIYYTGVDGHWVALRPLVQSDGKVRIECWTPEAALTVPVECEVRADAVLPPIPGPDLVCSPDRKGVGALICHSLSLARQEEVLQRRLRLMLNAASEEARGEILLEYQAFLVARSRCDTVACVEAANQQRIQIPQAH